MYKNFYNFNIINLIKIRLHLGHKDETLNFYLTSYIYGTRHNINIYNLDSLWKPYRYLFYSLTQIFFNRNTFLIIGTNSNLPMTSILKKLMEEYTFNENNSIYISGYIDFKWIGGLFTNWKIFKIFVNHIIEREFTFKKKYKFQKYFFFLKGLTLFWKAPVPDFIILLDKNKEAVSELKKFPIPIIGLIDTDMNPNNILFKFFGNNDAVENIEFFFKFLKEALNEGRLKEQQLFYSLFICKIKNKILKKNLCNII